jgi:hypothetical protein
LRTVSIPPGGKPLRGQGEAFRYLEAAAGNCGVPFVRAGTILPRVRRRPAITKRREMRVVGEKGPMPVRAIKAGVGAVLGAVGG